MKMEAEVRRFCRRPTSDCSLPEDVREAIKLICTVALVRDIGNTQLAKQMLVALVPIVKVKLKGPTKEQRMKRRSLMFPYDGPAMREQFALPSKLEQIEWRSAPETVDGWEYDVIPKGTIFYRGSSNFGQSKKKGTKDQYISCGFADKHSMPTYYTPDPLVANLYTAKSKEAPLQILKTVRTLKLLRLDSHRNFRRLVDKNVNDDWKAFATFFGNCDVSRHPDKQLVHGRLSGHTNDFAALKALCDKGFDGYSAGWICDFPPEIAVCEPLTSMVLDKIVHSRAFFTRSDYDKVMSMVP